MYVSISSAVPTSVAQKFDKPTQGVTRASEPESPLLDKRVDFSHITPRQLQNYINERIFSDTIDPDEATSIMGQLSTYQMRDAPDVPFDLRAQMTGTMEFHQDRGDPLAAWYAHLIKRLDEMEAQSLRVDAFA